MSYHDYRGHCAGTRDFGTFPILTHQERHRFLRELFNLCSRQTLSKAYQNGLVKDRDPETDPPLNFLEVGHKRIFFHWILIPDPGAVIEDTEDTLCLTDKGIYIFSRKPSVVQSALRQNVSMTLQISVS